MERLSAVLTNQARQITRLLDREDTNSHLGWLKIYPPIPPTPVQCSMRISLFPVRGTWLHVMFVELESNDEN